MKSDPDDLFTEINMHNKKFTNVKKDYEKDELKIMSHVYGRWRV